MLTVLMKIVIVWFRKSGVWTYMRTFKVYECVMSRVEERESQKEVLKCRNLRTVVLILSSLCCESSALSLQPTVMGSVLQCNCRQVYKDE